MSEFSHYLLFAEIFLMQKKLVERTDELLKLWSHLK
jgi:hypothetical protein